MSDEISDDLVTMAKYCIIEIDLGVICASMPSMPVLFRSLNAALKTRRLRKSSAQGPEYSARSGAPFTAPAWNSGKGAAVISSFPCPQRPEVSLRADHVQMTTTIDQTYWRDHSEDRLPLRNQQVDVRRPSHAYVNVEGWAEPTGHVACADVVARGYMV